MAETSVDVLISARQGLRKEALAGGHFERAHVDWRMVRLERDSQGCRRHRLDRRSLRGLAELGLFNHDARPIRRARGAGPVDLVPLLLRQPQLLRVIQERSFKRVGGNRWSGTQFRLVCATNRRLDVEIAAGRFRADLYYRIAVAFVEVPPLRERREDIPLLFEHFTLLAASRYERAAPMLNSAQLAELMAYAFPGNVRELRNIADRFVLGLLGDRLTLAREPVNAKGSAQRLAPAGGALRAHSDRRGAQAKKGRPSGHGCCTWHFQTDAARQAAQTRHF